MRQGRIANAMSRTVVNGLRVRLARLAAQGGSIQQPQLRPQACIDDFASCKRSYDQRCQLRDDTLCKTLSDFMPKQTASSRIANWIFASMFRVARMRRLLDCDKMSGDFNHSVNCRIGANRGRVVKTSVCLNNNLAVNSRER